MEQGYGKENKPSMMGMSRLVRGREALFRHDETIPPASGVGHRDGP